MQNILNEKTYNSIRQRIENLQPDAVRQFGKMDAAQMLAHCNKQLEGALGKIKLEDVSTFVTRNIIRRVLPLMNKIPKGTETSESLKVKDVRQFEPEKQKLLGNLDTLYKGGIKTQWYDHPAFGKMSGREWAHLIHLHLDHHLRQFSV